MSYTDLNKAVPRIICDECKCDLADELHHTQVGNYHYHNNCYAKVLERKGIPRTEYYKRRLERIQELKRANRE
jgi:hypothetical protein